MSNVFFTSDHHFFHKNCMKFYPDTRGQFSSIDELNERMISNWNELIKYDDEVYYLGDLSFAGDKETSELLHRLNGNIYYIKGNHDKGIQKHIKRFIWLKDIAEITVNGIGITLCHYAMRTWNKSHFGNWHLYGHCFSEDTELLTKRGFVKYNEIQKNDEALTLNLNSDILEYNKIKKIFIYDDHKELLSFSGKRGEILVTPEHNMVRISTYDNSYKKCTAEEAFKVSSLIIPLSAKHITDKINLSNELCVVLGLIISDGHFHYEESGDSGHGISIYQKYGKENFIKKALQEAGILYKMNIRLVRDTKMCSFYISAKEAKEKIYPWLVEKNISDILMNLRDTQFTNLLSGLIYGDGHVHDRTMSKIKICNKLKQGFLKHRVLSYCSKNEYLIDKLAHLCVLNGYSVNKKCRINHGFSSNPQYVLNISTLTTMHLKYNKRKRIKYSGKTWCVSVQNQTVVVRRNGFVFITGNSHGGLKEDPIAKSMDIGVDTNNFYPYHFDEIKDKLDKKPGYLIHHGKDRN